MFSRDSIIRLSLRRPGNVQSPVARWAASGIAAVGAAALIWSAVIHLKLWVDGYKDIHVIGPLFLAQGIVCIALAIALVILRWLVLQAVSAVTLAATAIGLLISANYGLFGLHETLAAPYSVLSLYVEFAGAGVLVAGTVLLSVAAQAVSAAGNPSPSPSRT